MNYKMTQSAAFSMVEIALARGEEIKIERGCMVYHNGGVALEGKMNSGGDGGLGGFMKAVGRSITSGESFFITHAKGISDGAKIAIAPAAPGAIRELGLGGGQQWRVRDQAFLACDGSVSYTMKRQSFGKAIFGGTGGFFIMETTGTGAMLLSSYGDILELSMDGSNPLVVDNTHVVAWSTALDYQIRAASGVIGFTTGEGLVNEFRGVGSVFIQTRNIAELANMLQPFLPTSEK